jgi:hypothetical protein
MLPPEHPETAARARLPGFEIDSPDKLMMPTTVKARPNAWVSQGFGAFWTLPLKIRMLAVLLFVAHLVAGGILTVAADKLSSAYVASCGNLSRVIVFVYCAELSHCLPGLVSFIPRMRAALAPLRCLSAWRCRSCPAPSPAPLPPQTPAPVQARAPVWA